jgi:hypothetical protein
MRQSMLRAMLFGVVVMAGPARAGELLRAPDAAYVQAGDNVASATVGVTWDVRWRRENDWGSWAAYLDLSLGGWHVPGDRAGSGHRDVTQVGITPVIRLRPTGWDRFFSKRHRGELDLSDLPERL